MRWMGLLLVTVWLVGWGCGEQPTRSQPPPKEGWGIPNARALDNLEAVLKLERGWRRDTVLVRIGNIAVDIDGRVMHGGAWTYTFSVVREGIEHAYFWEVWWDGRITFNSEAAPPILGNWVRDLMPVLQINSDRAIQYARRYDAEAFVQRAPGPVVASTVYRWRGEIPVIEMQFWVYDKPTNILGCEPEFWIHAETGELLYTTKKYCPFSAGQNFLLIPSMPAPLQSPG